MNTTELKHQNCLTLFRVQEREADGALSFANEIEWEELLYSIRTALCEDNSIITELVPCKFKVNSNDKPLGYDDLMIDLAQLY